MFNDVSEAALLPSSGILTHLYLRFVLRTVYSAMMRSTVTLKRTCTTLRRDLFPTAQLSSPHLQSSSIFHSFRLELNSKTSSLSISAPNVTPEEYRSGGNVPHMYVNTDVRTGRKPDYGRSACSWNAFKKPRIQLTNDQITCKLTH